eukprot:3815488-Alexandrium_andersonii.AAC.1
MTAQASATDNRPSDAGGSTLRATRPSSAIWQPRRLRRHRAASRGQPVPRSPGYSTEQRPPSRRRPAIRQTSRVGLGGRPA